MKLSLAFLTVAVLVVVTGQDYAYWPSFWNLLSSKSLSRPLDRVAVGGIPYAVESPLSDFQNRIADREKDLYYEADTHLEDMDGNEQEIVARSKPFRSKLNNFNRLGLNNNPQQRFFFQPFFPTRTGLTTFTTSYSTTVTITPAVLVNCVPAVQVGGAGVCRRKRDKDLVRILLGDELSPAKEPGAELAYFLFNDKPSPSNVLNMEPTLLPKTSDSNSKVVASFNNEKEDSTHEERQRRTAALFSYLLLPSSTGFFTTTSTLILPTSYSVLSTVTYTKTVTLISSAAGTAPTTVQCLPSGYIKC